MRVLKLLHELSSEFIIEKMKSSITITEYKRWQVLHLVKTLRFDAEQIANITNYSIANVYSIVQEFNKNQTMTVTPKAKGGRMREYIGFAKEEELMKSFETKALQGQILTAKDIKDVIEKRIQHKVSDDYIWKLFKRHGWTKHSPRPHHPKQNIEKQEEFKKNSKTIWIPLKLILNQK